jgi:hypothetical protein
MQQFGKRIRAVMSAGMALAGRVVQSGTAAAAHRQAVRYSRTGSEHHALDGKTIAGSIAVVVRANPNVVESVAFYLDDRRAAKAPLHVGSSAPFTLNTEAGLFDTRELTDGPHTLTVIKHRRNRRAVVTHISFIVDNAPNTNAAVAA